MPPRADIKTARLARMFDSELLFGVLFALLLVFHLAVNLWWLGADNHTIRTDEEVHMENARSYYEAMFLNDYDSFFERVIAVTRIKPTYPVHPPLLHIAGACTVAVFGYGVDQLALTNTLIFMLLLIGVYFLARQFLGQWQALFCVFVVSFTPAVYSCSRFMMTDFLAAALVVWAVYALLKTDRFQRTEWVFIFGVINGLAILTRTVAFLYYLAPAALIVAAGAWLLLTDTRGNRYPNFNWPRLFFHCLLTVVITLGVFGPWYFHNLEHYYNYWMEQRSGVVREIIPAGDEIREEAPQAAGNAQASSAGAAAAVMQRLLHPRVEWSRYPLLVINNSMFLPLFLLAVAGMAAALLHRRFRSLAALVLIVWTLSAYILMTQLFHFANPRYALAAVPALSILAAVGVLAVPWLRWRCAAMAGLSGFLLFAYGNLTVAEYKKLSHVEIPLPIESWALEQFGDTGLVVCKPSLPQSYSFSQVGPPSQLNYKDFYFNAMLREESRHETLRGEYANYQKLNTRGMEFDEKHYWPDSPFYRRDLPPELTPRRKLRFFGLGYAPEHLLPRLDNTDYIVYTINVGEEEKELAWQQYFAERGYKLIDRMRMEQFGAMAAQYFGVMAHEQVGQAIQLSTPEDVATLDLFDLYIVIMSPNFGQLSPEMQHLVRQRFGDLVNAPPYGRNFPMCEEASAMGADARRLDAGQYLFRIVMRVNKPFQKDFRMYIQAKPDPAATGLLTGEDAGKGYREWRFDPLPATSQWRAGEYVIVEHQIDVAPGTWSISFGFVSDTLGFHGQPSSLGWMDLGGGQ